MDTIKYRHTMNHIIMITDHVWHVSTRCSPGPGWAG